MTGTSTFFSIIIPTYNSSGTIATCLDSLASQRFKDFEVVVVDGKSLDDTLQLVANWDHHNKLVVSEKDHGIYDAMNKGIRYANGKWLYFLGSDDYLIDNDVLTDVHELLKHSKAKVAYGNVKVRGNNRWGKDGEIYGGRFKLYDILRRNICHQAIFYRQDFLMDNNLEYDLKYPVSADWDLNIRCWQLTRFLYFNRVISLFDSSGFSSTGNADNYTHTLLEKFPHLKGRYRMNPISNQLVKMLLPIKEAFKSK